MSSAFDICLQKLNDLVAAYRIYSHHALPLITRQRLPFSTLYATRSLDEPWDWVGMSMMLLHMNVPFIPDELSAEDIENISNRMSLALWGHPLMLSSGHAKEAQVAFERNGDYGEVLVQTQIAGEILLDGVLTLMLWEVGTSPEDSADYFEEGLRKRIRTHYASRLGGGWNLDTSPPLSEWPSKVAYVRGRVVHGGYRPTYTEAVEAQTAGEGLLEFVKIRLGESRTRFPRTTLLTLGQPGLERLGLWSGQIRRFAEREPDWLEAWGSWLASFGVWREEFERARNTP
jgi:hypothetical protein